ncbi:MAG: hypothetical protein ACI9MC_000964 [Kiritimatiellia bacterium]|jgi:hypothetical protein
MRFLCATVLLLAVACDGSIGHEEPPSIGIDVDIGEEPDCFDLSATRVDVDGDQASQLVIHQQCWSDLPIAQRVALDDPHGAFEIDFGGLTNFAGDDDLVVNVSLLATEAGSYDAQMLVGHEDSARAVQLYGQR